MPRKPKPSTNGQHTEEHDFQKFFYFFGVHLSTQGNELIGPCPFCQKENHFYVYNGPLIKDARGPGKDRAPGMFECKRCGEFGNHFTFLKRLWEESSEGSLEALVDARGLLSHTLRNHGILLSPITGGILLPSRNQSGSITNLYRGVETDKGLQIRSAPRPCKQQLYGLHLLKDQPYVILVEGHWDYLALRESLAHLAPTKDLIHPLKSSYKLKGAPNWESPVFSHICVLAVPGANTFKPEWGKYFAGKQVILIYDNDEPGLNGLAKAGTILSSQKNPPSEIEYIQWQEGDPNDVRDILLAS